MKIRHLVSLSTLALTIAGCGGGDIVIDAANNSPVDNSIAGDNIQNSNNTSSDNVPPTSNPCAAYIDSGITRRGNYDVTTSHCTYGAGFISLTKPYVQLGELVFDDLPNNGVHIFEGTSLVIGQNYSSDEALNGAGISEGGDGSALRIAAGATLAFSSDEDYFIINRGSQIFAEGNANAPVTITSVSDAVLNAVDPEADGEWGGMIINGFGVTNKCAYTGSQLDGTLVITDGEECHVEAEGKDGAGQSHYGGANNADNSGMLNYFVIKHTGAQVAPGNELNGISFNAVGSGTSVDFLQAYATLDDGIEMFGGAVNISHYIGMYVRDDSIDIDEGYQGTIDWALVIQSEEYGNQCVESDGIGSYSSQDATFVADLIARGLNSRATIKNLTCIISPSVKGTRGPGAGIRIREAHFPTLENVIMTTAYGPVASDPDAVDEEGNPAPIAAKPSDHFCLRIEHEGGQAALDGELIFKESVFACNVLSKGDLNGSSTEDWMSLNNNLMSTVEAGEDPSNDAIDVNISLLDGFYSLPVSDMVINGGTVSAVPTDGRILGAVSATDDWTAGWAYGLDPANRGQALWFE